MDSVWAPKQRLQNLQLKLHFKCSEMSKEKTIKSTINHTCTMFTYQRQWCAHSSQPLNIHMVRKRKCVLLTKSLSTFSVLPLEITSSKSRICLSMDHKNIDRQFCSSFRTRSEDLIERMSSKTTLKIRLFIKPTATRHVMNEGLKNSEDVGTE